MNTFIKSICFLLFILTGCQPNTLEDYHKAGYDALKNLCKELHEVHTLDDLIQKAPKLKKEMRHLTELMIEADQYHRKHPEESFITKPAATSDMLRYELTRICEEIEGARALLEEIQEETLDKLDLYERRKKAAALR